ncbi:MAG: VWA domain-containing protein [Burkholderiales bacterium]|nr:VWA domain-containing protein [Burkholderiales bacterium]
MADGLKGLETWNDAMTSLQLLQIDSHGWGGIWLRAPFGPVRELWLRHLSETGLNTVKLPGNIDVERLLGGIDLSRTLQSGLLQMQTGLLQQADLGLVCISMAERFPTALIAPMTQAMDTQSLPPLKINNTESSVRTQFGVVALDESMADDPPMSPALAERLGLWFDLQDIAPSDVSDVSLNTRKDDNALDVMGIQIAPDALARMKQSLPHIQWTDEQVLAVCSTAQGLGIDSLRVPTLALRVACCHAALHARSHIADDDLAFAARRVLAPRATQLPAPAENASDTEPQNSSDSSAEPDQAQEQSSNSLEPTETPNPSESAKDEEDTSSTETSEEDTNTQDEAPSDLPSSEKLQEMMIAAALASLPPDVLDGLLTKPGRNLGNTSGRSGQFRSGMQRGRPLPPRTGRPGGHARLHILSTLRAAAPKQRLRGNTQQGRVAIRSEDFHVHRYQQHSSSCLILALDASGSAALQRLAEAKGAVELLLQQSYARRDSVCIVSFKGARAQLLLPMTRSLVRAKRAMMGLPGGGGTPLALALKMACEQATHLQRQGVTPILVVLSDGRANVNLQGLGGRAQAQADAQQWAAQWRQTGHRCLWIDTSLQPDTQVQNMAQTMGGSYLPMPQVQAQRMASAMENLRRQAV